MADSFFGFSTTLPDDEGGGNDRENEEHYDAMNDETFGDAINGDWEGMHESFVRLDRQGNVCSSNESRNKSLKATADYDHESDLEINLSRFELEDCIVAADDLEGRLQLDPSVWSSPAKSMQPTSTIQKQQHQADNENFSLYGNPDLFIQRNFSQPFNNFPSAPNHQQSSLLDNITRHQMLQSSYPKQSQPILPSSAKIMSVEDIERNIRSQQQANQVVKSMMAPQNSQQQQNIPSTVADIVSSIHSQLSNNSRQQQAPQRHPNGPPGMMMPPQQQQNQMGGPPRPIYPPPHQIPPNRLPPGFPPHHLMGNNIGPLSGQMHQQQPPPGQNMGGRHMPQPPNMQMPMHPMNFGPMRHGVPPPQQPPHPHQQMQQRMPPPPPHFGANQYQQQQQQHNVQNLQNSVNQFNKRLVQEIQQNHPLLQQFNRLNNNGNTNMNYNQQNNSNHNNNSNNGGNNNNNHKNQQQHHNNRYDGNLNNYHDEYANLMSTRDKHWLIGIQLMQLNTDTPYIDDFYYTVYKERQKQKIGDHENKTYKDNTLNHPLTQPKGHAQLLMMLGKNGNINHQRNGHLNNRERKNSESSTKNDKDNNQQTPRTYTPLQFEKSLGKLQCGSVTAPRKIIDMDIVGPEISNALNSASLEISVQRRSRQLLLHIETMYKIVLKMEDLENPTAIAAAQILKEKREKEKQLALEQAKIDELINGESSANANNLEIQRGLGGTLGGNPMNQAISANMPEEPEVLADLMPKLIAGLTTDKIIAMMNVRKGKTLLRRILPLIRDHIQRWDVWCDIFATLCMIVKKDRDDTDGLLLNFYPEFRNQIQYAGMDDILRLAITLVTGPNEKKLGSIVESRFCILAIIAMILRVEQFYQITQDLVQERQKEKWLLFLNTVENFNSNSNNNNAQQRKGSNASGGGGGGAIDGELTKSLLKHFSRFRELKAQQLLTVLSQIELK